MKYLIFIFTLLLFLSCEPETKMCYYCDEIDLQFWGHEIQTCWDDHKIECKRQYNHYVLLQCKQWWLDKHCKYREVKVEYAEYVCSNGFAVGTELLSEEYQIESQKDKEDGIFPEIKYDTSEDDC